MQMSDDQLEQTTPSGFAATVLRKFQFARAILFGAGGRTGVVFRTATMAALGRVLGIASSFILIPLILQHLGPQQYGLWLTLLAYLAFLDVADGGVSVGISYCVAQADGRRDEDRIKRLTSTAIAVTGTAGLIALLGGIGLASSPALLGRLLGLDDPQLISTAAGLILVLTGAFFILAPINVIRRVRQGLQHGAAIASWDLAGNVVSFISQIGCILAGGGLLALVASAQAGVLFAGLGSAIWFLRGLSATRRPSIASLDRHAASELYSVGSTVVLLSLFDSLSMGSATLLTSHLIGPAAVAEFATVWKLTSLLFIFSIILYTAQLPSFVEAIECGDRAWVRHHALRTLLLAILANVIGGLMLGLFGQAIVKLWIGNAISPTSTLIWSAAASSTLIAIGVFFRFFLFANNLRVTVNILYGVFALLSYVIGYFFIKLFGLPGAPLAIGVSFCIAVLIPGAVIFFRRIRNLKAAVP